MKVAGPIGLLGGSFDPVHRGHLQLAQDAQRGLGLSELVFVPAGQPWQKSAVTAATHRCRMLERALGAHAGWRIDTIEIDRPGPSYTVETLRALRSRVGPEQALVWILGFDQLRQLPTWNRWKDLLDFAHLAYAPRAGVAEALDAQMSRFVQEHRAEAAAPQRHAHGTLVEFAMQPVDCSATQIREALASGQERRVAQFLPPEVLEYIHSQQLYPQIHGK